MLVAGHETEILNFIRQAKSLNVSPTCIELHGRCAECRFPQGARQDADYAFGMTSWLPSASLKDPYFGDAAQFAQAYQKKFGYEPDYHAASAVADVEAYVKAIEAAKGVDPAKVRDAMAGLDFESLYGRVRFNTAGQISLAQTVIQVQNGKVVPIYGPKGFRQATVPDAGMEQTLGATALADSGQRRSAGRTLRLDGVRPGAGLGRAQHREPGARGPDHARGLRLLLPVHGLRLDPFAALPRDDADAVCLRIPDPALRAQSGDPGADVQYAADHLRDRRRDDLSGADNFQRRFPHHQSELRRRNFALFGATVPWSACWRSWWRWR